MYHSQSQTVTLQVGQENTQFECALNVVKPKSVYSKNVMLIPEGTSKGKVCLKAREQSCEEADLPYEEELTDVESGDERLRQCSDNLSRKVQVKQLLGIHRT